MTIAGAEGIPFLDLPAQHRAVSGEILAAWRSILESAAFVGGAEVRGFEEEFAAYVGAPFCVGVANGTDALRLALLALDVGPGDEVVTVPHTFVATTEAIRQAGARPVFVDVDPATATMDPALLEAAITGRTRAVVPVHLYGQTADMDPILEIARRRGIAVVEDACQAHGARYRGRAAGSIGDAAAFSFYPGKNLGACGEAGAVTTARAEVAARVARLRDHGQSTKYVHEEDGWNARLDALQAAALRVKLRHLDAWNESREEAARRYASALSGSGIALPVEAAGRKHAWHLYVVRHERRERLREALASAGIGSGLHYPVPVHLQKPYLDLGHARGSFPASEAWADRGLSLPMFPGLSGEAVDRVADVLKQAAG
jgi:dTDP-4-amino-4,6-dideoxygalactose transaminase